jgi:outer membrane protein assembly factor BamB
VPVERPTYCGVILAVTLALVGSVVRPAAIDAAQSSRKPAPVPPAPLAAEAGWNVELPAPASAGAAMDAERVFVPTEDGHLVALHRESGDTDWSIDLASALVPLAAGPVLVAGTVDTVVGLEPATGVQRWATPVKTAPLRALALSADGTVVLVVSRTRIEALRASTGAREWERDITTTDDALRVTTDATAAYVATGGGRIISVALLDGAPQWARELPGTLSAPAASAGRVYVGSTANEFHALDARTGKTHWTWRTGADVVGSAVNDRFVYMVALDNVLRAVNRGNGHQRWKQALATRPVAPPVVVPGHVLVPGIDPALASFEAVTGIVGGTLDGQAVGTAGAPSEVMGSPLVDQAMRPFRVSLVLLWRDGHVTGLRPASMLFREPAPSRLPGLPGRVLTREVLPTDAAPAPAASAPSTPRPLPAAPVPAN